MGFKCSVLGHRFEEPGLVHEREQRGNEVIIITRKVRICTLCGEQRILAESKEITKQIDDDSADATDDETDSVSAGASDGSVTDTIDEIDTNGRRDESSIAHAPSESRSTDLAENETAHDEAVMVDEDNSTMIDLRRTDDDGVILTDDETDTDTDTVREYGEWPAESSESGVDTSWNSDAVETPTPTSPRSNDTTNAGETTTADADTEFHDGEIIEPPSEPPDKIAEETTNEEQTLFCRTCDFSVIASDSPFRSGDICPGCHESYLTDGV